MAVEDTARGDTLDGLASEFRGRGFRAEFGHGRNQDGGRDVASVATAFTTLGADQIDAEFEAFLDMLDMADHVLYMSVMQLI